MKKLLFLLTLSLSFFIASSQTSVVKSGPSTPSKVTNYAKGTYYPLKNNVAADTITKHEIFAVHTPAKDTLFILKCEIGILTQNIWKQDPKYKGKNPVIIMTDDIAYYQRKYIIKRYSNFRN